LLSLIASFNAAYLTYSAYLSEGAQKVFWTNSIDSYLCDINSTFSCSTVFNHDFSWILWIPFSLLALIVYPLIILIAVLWLLNKIKNHYKILFFIGLWWIIFNSYIIYNEYVVWVYCLLCLICSFAIITTAILSKIGMKK
jgi:uncharacterized membrane protein